MTDPSPVHASKHELVLAQAIFALLAGAITGGCLTAFLFAVYTVKEGGLPESSSGLQLILGIISVFIMYGVIASLVFLFGLIFVAVPIWIIFHYLKWTHPVVSVAMGTLLTGAANKYVFDMPVWMVFSMSVIGGIIGYTVWRLSYATDVNDDSTQQVQ